MKTAVIYYSLEGNMEYIVKKITQDNIADSYKLIPEKEYPTGKISKFIWGGKSATFGERPKLINDKIDLSKYDMLVIGSPVWAGTITPPLNTFFHDYSIVGKDIILIATHAGGGADKCFAKMQEHLKDNKLIKTFQFVNPLRNQDNTTMEQIEEIRQLINKKI